MCEIAHAETDHESALSDVVTRLNSDRTLLKRDEGRESLLELREDVLL